MPVFQHFFDRSFCFAEDFRDQSHVFSRLSCIENSLPENMGRILEGVKGFPVPPTGGGWGVPLSSCPFLVLVGALSLSRGAFLPSSFGLRSLHPVGKFSSLPLGDFQTWGKYAR